MPQERKIFFAAFLIFCILFVGAAGPSHAAEIITFGPYQTRIEGAIKYTVIGRYTAHFNRFKGRITLDEHSQRLQSVYLEIQAASIKSDHPWYDKLARSRRLLYATRYPKIIFKSDKIIEDDSGYKVRGILEMRGVKRIMVFPFKIDMTIDPKTQGKLIDLEGNWDINRKDFNIIWNKYLDHGGIVVADIFTVNWGIRAYIK